VPEQQIRRGEVWRYDAVIQTAAGHRLVVTSDAVLDQRPARVLTLPIDPAGKHVEDLLTVEIPGYGWVNALLIDSTVVHRLWGHVATVDPDVWESVALRLRTVLGED